MCIRDRLNTELGFKINGVEPAVLETLKQYSWPGNIRELRNVIERAMNFATGDRLTLDDFTFFTIAKKTSLPDYSSNRCV